MALGDGPVVVKVRDADDPEATAPFGELGYVDDCAGANDGNAFALVRRDVR